MPPLSQDDLWQAWERVQENAGCAGADGLTVDQFARHGHAFAHQADHVERRQRVNGVFDRRDGLVEEIDRSSVKEPVPIAELRRRVWNAALSLPAKKIRICLPRQISMSRQARGGVATTSPVTFCVGAYSRAQASC